MAVVDRGCRCRLIGFAAFLSVLLAPNTQLALAQRIEGCPIEVNEQGSKIVIASLGDLSGAIGLRLARRLEASLEMRFEQAKAALHQEAQVFYCADRKIRSGEAYDESVVGVLNNAKVLLEIGAKRDASDISVTYLVIPVRLYHHFRLRENGNPGLYSAIYEESRISAGLEKLFKDNLELRLMTALALAIRHETLALALTDSVERQYGFERSRAFYCDAIGSAETARPGNNEFGLAEREWQSLRQLAADGAERMFRNAINSSNYAGTLRAVVSERADVSDAMKQVCVLQSSGGRK